jgi:phage tail sheath protein FI
MEMPEYLSPGVYVEIYDSGAIPMQGAFTDIAGFVGLTEKGPITGKPQLVKSFDEYKNIYGGYLSEATPKPTHSKDLKNLSHMNQKCFLLK